MGEHPTNEQLEALRQAGWTIVTTLNGLKAHRGDRTIGWREALSVETERQEQR